MAAPLGASGRRHPQEQRETPDCGRGRVGAEIRICWGVSIQMACSTTRLCSVTGTGEQGGEGRRPALGWDRQQDSEEAETRGPRRGCRRGTQAPPNPAAGSRDEKRELTTGRVPLAGDAVQGSRRRGGQGMDWGCSGGQPGGFLLRNSCPVSLCPCVLGF